MTPLSRRELLLGASAFAIGGCAADDRFAAVDADEPRGGIGGTGIVGVVTDFGSLIVNGKRVKLDWRTQIRDAFGSLSEGDLAIGQGLTIEAATEDGRLVARRVVVSDPLIGEVTSVDEAARAVTVNGVRAVLEPGAGALPARGDRVKVSGLWRGDIVSASRIAPTGSGDAVVSGVARRDAENRVRIGDALIRPSILTFTPPVGAFVTARGRMENGAFAAREVVVGRFTGAAGPLQNLSVEGYLAPLPVAPFYELTGLGHSFDAEARLAALADGRALFEGRYTGAFAVETGLPLPDAAPERAAILGAALRGEIAPERLISTR
ncbi:MAG: DUF5666 domain-containing protein [Pseudomonadota bacterium]